jgi:PAS domain-containing protein
MDEARIILAADGRILDANDAALRLYNLTLDELRAAPPGAFAADPQTPEEQAAFRETWESSGRPDLVGSATLRRLDGSTVRVQFGITAEADGTFVAILRAVEAWADERRVVYTAGEVLARWRDAERQLEAIPADSPEASRVQREIERFREAYQHVFRSARGNGSPA